MNRTDQALLAYVRAEQKACRAKTDPKVSANERRALQREAEQRKSILTGLQKHEPTTQQDTAESRIARKRGEALMAASRQRQRARIAGRSEAHALYLNPLYETSSR
jgi:hypothetical protein